MSLFVYHKVDLIIYLLLYVDDVIYTSNNNDLLSKFFTTISTYFSLKDMWDLHFFLALESYFQQVVFFISQQNYTLDICEQSNMHKSKEVLMPMHRLISSPFRMVPIHLMPKSFVVLWEVCNISLLNLSDIAFAINRLSQYMQQPIENHWAAIKCLLWYLKGTSSYSQLLQ